MYDKPFINSICYLYLIIITVHLNLAQTDRKILNFLSMDKFPRKIVGVQNL